MEEGGNSNIAVKGKRRGTLFKRIFSSKNLLILCVIVIVLIVIILSWILLIDKYEGCKTWECFNENLAACDNAKFAGGKEVIFGYVIQGKKNDLCIVEVEFLQGEISNKNAKKLIGQKMTCELPRGIIMLPESDLSRCSGELKEKLQEQVIEQLHNFIVQNLGQINKELLNPLKYQET